MWEFTITFTRALAAGEEEPEYRTIKITAPTNDRLDTHPAYINMLEAGWYQCGLSFEPKQGGPRAIMAPACVGVALFKGLEYPLIFESRQVAIEQLEYLGYRERGEEPLRGHPCLVFVHPNPEANPDAHVYSASVALRVPR